jgi:hypothetical protein
MFLKIIQTNMFQRNNHVSIFSHFSFSFTIFLSLIKSFVVGSSMHVQDLVNIYEEEEDT